MDKASPGSSDRSDGYVTEIDYVFKYYRWTNPQYLRLALLRAGIVPPRVETACDLGFGQGVSLAIHAASGPASWIGNDINPDHRAHAARLLSAAGVGAGLYEDPFVAFAERDDLPDLDFVVAHGIWSWVSDRNRGALVRLVERRLKPGGVFYLSYNALPGQATFEPVRHLAAEIARRNGAGRDLPERMAHALDLTGRLLSAQPAYLEDAPTVASAFEAEKRASPHYLAHEYFNRDWRPMHFADVARWLGDAGLQWVGSAGYEDTLESLRFTPAQRALLDETADPILRETARDFLVNRPFRKDYWMKSPTVDRVAADRQLHDERFVRVGDGEALPVPVRGALILQGKAALERTASAMLDLVADGRPRVLGDIAAALSADARGPLLGEAVALLVDCNLLAQAQPGAAIAHARPATARLNAFLLEDTAAGGAIRALASPVLGGGVRMTAEDQRALRDGTLAETRLARLLALGVSGSPTGSHPG